MGMLGNQLAAGQALTVANDSFNGDGSATAFTLSQTVSSVNDIEVLVDNVQQSPYDGSYSVSGTTLTFSGAPSAGTNNVYVIYNASKHITTSQVIPDNGSVTHSKFHSTALNPITLDQSNNRVGINTTSPASELHITHPTSSAAIKLDAPAGQQASFLLSEGGANKYNISSVASDNHFQVYNYYNNTRALGISDTSIITQPYQPILALQPDTSSNVTVPNSNVHIVGWKTVGGRQTLLRSGLTLSGNNSNTIANGNNTGRITFSTGGVYYFDCTIRFENTPGTGNIYVYFNGCIIHRVHVEEWTRYNYAHGRVSRCVTASAGDYIEFGLARNNGIFSGSNDTVNWLTIIKVA